MPMPKRHLLIASILVVELASGAFAAPIKRAHKPWLMIGGSAQETVTPAPSTPARPRTVTRPRRERVVRASRPRRIATEPHETPTGRRVADQALKYKGTRYKFGGNNKRGIDCSGLVARVFEDLKLKKVPRMSSALYKSGTAVGLNELRPGDLVFFKNTYRRGVSHVGVYTGNNKFVHASNERRGVTVTRLSDPYYQLHYAGARRLF